MGVGVIGWTGVKVSVAVGVEVKDWLVVEVTDWLVVGVDDTIVVGVTVIIGNFNSGIPLAFLATEVNLSEIGSIGSKILPTP